MKIATWNINSVRLREPIVLKFANEYQPDVICLQETKCPDEKFPHDELDALGFTHRVIRGEKGYNGVAILSKLPIDASAHHDFCAKGDCRHLSAKINGITIHNFYVPAGGDVPDRDENLKFGHKLDFLDEMAAWFGKKGKAPKGSSILVGDLNIAPMEHDVWSHKQLLKIVSHTPIEVEKLTSVQASRDWVDTARHFTPAEEKLYSWWSYRAKDWEKANKGRRLDHIWATPDLKEALVSCETIKPARGWEKPSDHAPVVTTLAL